MARKGKNSSKRRDKTRFAEQENRQNFSYKKQKTSTPSQPEERVKDEQLFRKAIETTKKSINNWKEISDDIKKNPPPKYDDIVKSLDPWQKEAFDALIAGENVIVDAPTTAGKTRVVEAYFTQFVNDPGFRAAYTAPVKSLSNDKLREFSDMFGTENVGIATGDVKKNLTAPIVVATLESYRNSLLGVEPDLARSLAVFDEYHFLQDSSRGSAWEEALILTPRNCQILLLSASVENASEFSKWLENISKRPCRLISAGKRPVPLENLVCYRGEWVLGDELETLVNLKDTRIPKFPLDLDQVSKRVTSAEKLGLTPAIVYSGRRLSCEQLAANICKYLEPLNKELSLEIKEIIEGFDEVENPTSFLKSNLRKMLLVYGVGFHHSGIAPPGRRIIELLVKQGKLRYCVATMGLSIGINFSVKSTMISDFRRPGDQGFTDYGPSEVLQMLGRAGRRGKDAVGYSLWPSIHSYKKFAKTKREHCESRLKNDPTTLLGLIGRDYKPKDIERFYEKSFLSFQNRKTKFNIITAKSVMKALSLSELPMHSPVHHYADFVANEQVQSKDLDDTTKRIHKYLRKELENSLCALHFHLHFIGCINEAEKLTGFGDIARFFPQSGGLLVASMLHNEEISEEKLLTSAQLMASIATARFKSIKASEAYEYPYDYEEIEELLEAYYPIELFEEIYDPPNKFRDTYVIKDFNPAAGEIIKLWAEGESWEGLCSKFTHEKFGQGDLMNVIYRVATYLQSIAQCSEGDIKHTVLRLRDEILRPPLLPNT